MKFFDCEEHELWAGGAISKPANSSVTKKKQDQRPRKIFLRSADPAVLALVYWRRATLERLRAGQDGFAALLDDQGGAVEIHVCDFGGPFGVGAGVGGGDGFGGGDVEIDASVFDVGDGLAAGDVEVFGLAGGDFAGGISADDGGGAVGIQNDRDIFIAQAGDRAGGREGGAVVGESRADDVVRAGETEAGLERFQNVGDHTYSFDVRNELPCEGRHGSEAMGTG